MLAYKSRIQACSRLSYGVPLYHHKRQQTIIPLPKKQFGLINTDFISSIRLIVVTSWTAVHSCGWSFTHHSFAIVFFLNTCN